MLLLDLQSKAGAKDTLGERYSSGDNKKQQKHPQSYTAEVSPPTPTDTGED